MHICSHFCCKRVHCGIFVWSMVGFVRWVYCIGSGNGFTPNRCQTFIWTNDDPVHWHIYVPPGFNVLTHWGRVMHICVGNLTIFGSDNGLSPGRCQAIIWANAGILLIGPLGINISEILIEILTFSFKKIRLKVLSAKCRPFCLILNVLTPLASFFQHSLSEIVAWINKCIP